MPFLPPNQHRPSNEGIIVKNAQFKTVCKDDSGYIVTQLKQQKSKR